jgi:hypothetical protein
LGVICYYYFLPDGIALVGQWDTSQGVVTAMAKNDIVIAGFPGWEAAGHPIE